MTETTQMQPALTTCTATTTLNEHQKILIQRLKEAGLNTKCFLKVGGSFDEKTGEFKPKAAFESEWQKHLYSPEDFDKICYCIICKGKQPHERWGITGGCELVILDSDDQRLYNALNNTSPETFEVTSARRKIPAKYFVVYGPQVQNLHLYIPEEKASVGEMRADNWYVVAPGTTIPYKDLKTNEEKTGTYTITKNRPITRLEYNDFMKAITPFLGSNPTQKITIEAIENGVSEGERTTDLFKETCAFIRMGISPQFTYEALKLTASKCNPPFTDDDELKRMIKNAVQYKDKAQNNKTLNIPEQPQQTEPQETTTQETITLTEVKKTFKKWLYLEGDDEVIDVVLAASIDRRVKGDPLWLLLISASGGTKTEIVRNIKNKDIYTLDSVTAHSFVSGKIDKDADGNPVPVEGILKEINGKILIIKDFTVLLSKRQEDRDEIFSQLRSLYDGYIEFAFGTSPTPVRIEAKIGLIAAVTPAIDTYTKMYLALGERFLKIRHHPDPKKATHEALSNMGKEDEMRTELTSTTSQFLTTLQINDDLPPIPETYSLLIEDIAFTVAILRTPVPMNIWKFEMNNTAQPVTEYPTRLAKQLKKLACSLSIIRGEKEVTIEDIKTMKRVARDTCVPNRILIVDALMPKAGKEAESFTTRDITHKIKIPLTSCWRELKEMEVLSLVEYTQARTETGTYSNYTKHTPENDGWKLLNLELANILATTEIIAPHTLIEKEPKSGCFTNFPPTYINKIIIDSISSSDQRGMGGGELCETPQNKPRWFVKEISPGAKCECGKYAVTKEIITPQHELIKRCASCLKKLQEMFDGAEFFPAYPF